MKDMRLYSYRASKYTVLFELGVNRGSISVNCYFDHDYCDGVKKFDE